MKNLKVLLLSSLVLCFAFTLISWYSIKSSTNKSKRDSVIVTLQFKAQPGKEAQALEEFAKLIDQVKAEPYFVSIKIHVGENDKTNIMLYEEWEDLNYYQTAHNETEYLQEFMVNSRNFLMGPPEVSFWKVNQIFE